MLIPTLWSVPNPSKTPPPTINWTREHDQIHILLALPPCNRSTSLSLISSPLINPKLRPAGSLSSSRWLSHHWLAFHPSTVRLRHRLRVHNPEASALRPTRDGLHKQVPDPGLPRGARRPQVCAQQVHLQFRGRAGRGCGVQHVQERSAEGGKAIQGT